ncbi:MAG: DUF3857 domain-containing protein, partial [Bacteroidota bacterium]|nr:DUF3857 domain-containing protein [Bacteroidota bacterium]
MRTPFLLIVFLGLFTVELLSQTETSEGPVTAANFSTIETPLIQENTAAVVLSDLGDIKVGSTDWFWFGVKFSQKKRIRLLNKKAFNLATVSVYLYGSDKLDSLNASTYNLEDGRVKEVSLSKDELYQEKLGTGVTRIRFTFPAVREGSIIEYSIFLASNRVSMLPDWRFQHRDIPCLYSRLRVATPEVLRYLITTRGIDSIRSEVGETTNEVVKIGSDSLKKGTRHQTWTARNIPAFSETSFIHSPSDYLDRIEFFLVQAYDGMNGMSRMTWQSVDNDLMSIESFGRAFLPERNRKLRSVVEQQTVLAGSPLESAKMLYAYVRDNFVCTGNDG